MSSICSPSGSVVSYTSDWECTRVLHHGFFCRWSASQVVACGDAYNDVTMLSDGRWNVSAVCDGGAFRKEGELQVENCS
jgi:hypothetical protein